MLQLIGQASQPLVRVEGAGPVEVTVRRKPGAGGELVVHLVNYAGQRQSAYEEPPALHGLRLGVRADVGQGRALVGGVAVKPGARDAQGYAWLEVPAVKHFEAILLQMAEA